MAKRPRLSGKVTSNVSWSQDEWTELLTNECGMTNERARQIASKLVEQDFNTVNFGSFVQMFDKDPEYIRKDLEDCGFSRLKIPSFVEALRRQIANATGTRQQTPSNTVKRHASNAPTTEVHIPLKKPSIEIVAFNTWYKKALPFLFYIKRNNDENNPKRCVTVIHPQYCVTYRHGQNKNIKVRRQEKKGVFIPGEILTIYSQMTGMPFQVEAVLGDEIRDFIILKTHSKKPFYEGDLDTQESHVLEMPTMGRHCMVLGFSTKEPGAMTGTVIDTALSDPRFQMTCDVITWGADSGAPVISPDSRVLGMVSRSINGGSGSDTGMTRTRFVPAKSLLEAIKVLMGYDIDSVPACEE